MREKSQELNKKDNFFSISNKLDYKMMCCELMETKKIIMKLIKSHRKKYEPSPFKVRLVYKNEKRTTTF